MIKWLLRNNPALLGDLLEERAAGRSRAWFWKQIVVAVGRSTFGEVRRHPVLMLRAVATALLVYLAASTIDAVAFGYICGYLFPIFGNVYPTSLWFLIPLIVFPSLVSGWVMARTHPACLEAAIVAIMLLWLPIAMPINPWTPTANIIGLLAGAYIEVKRRERTA